MKRTFLIAALSFTSLALTAILIAVLGNGAALAMQDGPGINAPQQAEPNLRVAHLAPFAADPGTAVTVTLDGDDVLTGFEFADSTVYFTQTAESHLVEIYAPGQPITPAITATVELEADTDYSAIAIGGANDWPLELLALVDDTEPLTDAAKIRIGHLAPFAALITDTLADIRLQDGTVVITNVAYKGYADIVLPAGTHDLKITTPGGDVTLIDPLPVTVADGDILSIFAVGDGVNQPLGVFAWPSNAEGFLLPLAFTDVDLSLVTTGTIYVGDEVEFSADLTPDNAYKPYTYTIDFGDGVTVTASSSADPLLFEHTYTMVGTNTVEIQVWNDGNVEPVIDTVEVVVEPVMTYIYLPIIAKNF